MADGLDKFSGKMEEIGSGITSFLSRLGENIKNEGLRGVSITFNENRPLSKQPTKRSFEINLVPSVKSEMLKTQKARNLVLFVCIVISIASGTILGVFGVFTLSQSGFIGSKDEHIKLLKNKVDSFSGLDNILTLQGQFEKISEINKQKNSLSRIFGILSVILAQDKDKVVLSNLKVNLGQSLISFEAQADAGKEPYIDYRVLDAFSKSIARTTYDYGRYVTESGSPIPARCVKDTTREGTILIENGSVYGLWYRQEKGCDPDRKDDGKSNEVVENNDIDNKIKNLDQSGTDGTIAITPKDLLKPDQNTTGVITERYRTTPEKIWRTPQFTEWYKEDKINRNGKISGVAHFESNCIKYYGDEINGEIHWKTAENKCMLAANPEKGLEVSDSSNGRNSNDNLVLRFTAKLSINPDVFKFENKHVIAVAPTGQNVTDSYIQIQDMFEPKAKDCLSSDATCKTTEKEKEKK